jgi:hypothetical protein
MAWHPLWQFVGIPLGTAAFWRLSNLTPSVKAKAWSPIENEFDLESFRCMYLARESAVSRITKRVFQPWSVSKSRQGTKVDKE